jgi:hypothetical protein
MRVDYRTGRLIRDRWGDDGEIDPGPGAGWVFPGRDNKHREEAPYSYSDFWHWRSPDMKGVGGDYSDRMQGWNHARWRSGFDLPETKGKSLQHWGKPECSAFLTHFWERPIEAMGLSEGCNASIGYPFFVFYYREIKPEVVPHAP